MREVPRIADVLRVHIWSPIMAVGMLSILYFAGRYLGDRGTIAKIEMLFGSAPDASGAWLVIPWAIIVEGCLQLPAVWPFALACLLRSVHSSTATRTSMQ